MDLLRPQTLTIRSRGLLNAAAVGVLAAGLVVLVPRAVVVLSIGVERVIQRLLPNLQPDGPTALLFLFALPPVYQILLAIAVLYAYGAGTRGQPAEDRNQQGELIGLAIALGCVAISAVQHARPGWSGLILLLPLLLQAGALIGLLPDQRALLLVYGPAAVLFCAGVLLMGRLAAPWLDLLLIPAVPILAFAIGRLLRLMRLQCGFGAHATMAVIFGFVLAFGLARVLERVVGLS